MRMNFLQFLGLAAMFCNALLNLSAAATGKAIFQPSFLDAGLAWSMAFLFAWHVQAQKDVAL